MIKDFKTNNGFTLLEVLLAIAIISVLAGISIPLYQSFQVKNDLDIATNVMAQTLRRAQVLSQAVSGDSSWGVYIQSGSITLFQGNDYLSRNTDFDELFDLPASIYPAGVQEVVFTKLWGEPQVTGDIILTSSTNEAQTITINEKGAITY